MITETAMQSVDQTIKNIKHMAPQKSAWDRGVLQTAIEMLQGLDVDVIPMNPDPLRKVLLNGAENWNDWAYGGCGLIYDEDICRRYMTPSIQRRYDYGRKPMPHETYLDTEARAALHAYQLISKYVFFTC